MKNPPTSSHNANCQDIQEKQLENITEKIVVCQTEQGPETFRKYSLKNAIEELDELFDS
ncbi:hypothetical protein [Candidatus Hodarchaeum mangrovi]